MIILIINQYVVAKIKLNLPIISEIKIDKKRLYESFTDIKNIANIRIFKCYKLL